MTELMVAGRIRSPYGLKGWVWMDSFTHDPASLFDWKPWILTRQAELSGRPAIRQIETAPETWKARGKFFVVRLKGYSERASIELLVNCLVEVNQGHLPILGREEFYWRDLEGCRVETTDNTKLGFVKTVMATGSNDVLVVRGDLASVDQTERLIPFICQTVLEVNIEKRLILVDWDPEF